MKKPSFALYAAGYVLCIAACFACVVLGTQFNIPGLLVLSGATAVWSSMIFYQYHKRLNDYWDSQIDMSKLVSDLYHGYYAEGPDQSEVQ